MSNIPVAGVDDDRVSSFIDHRLNMLNERFHQSVLQENYFYQSEINEIDGSWVTISGRRMLMLCSYSYLGLIGHPMVYQAAAKALAEFGTGTHGVRLLAGTTTLHRELELAIAKFHNTADAIVFSSGYATNIAAISTLINKDHVVICDILNHASIFDACTLSGAKLLVYRHNNMKDLKRCLERAGEAGKLIVTDAVFSMDGDIANLPEIVDISNNYGAEVMVDEAHSLGVIGATGKGITEHFSLSHDAIGIKMGTLSKAIPSAGGYVTGSSSLINALKHNAHAFIFSGAPPPPQMAAALAAIDVIQDEPQHLIRLQHNSQRYGDALRDIGFNTLNSTTQIVPIICPDEATAFEMTRLCHESGLFVSPVVYPAVPVRLPRLRTTVTAAHTDSEIDFAVSVLERAARKCGIVA